MADAGVAFVDGMARREAVPPRTRLLLEGAVLPTLLKLAAPNLFEAVARVGFIAADGWFVSWLGQDALAGVSLVFPLFIVTQMISAGGIGIGVSASVAGALGAGRREEAERLAFQALWIALAAGALVAAAMLAGGPALYRAFGARGGALAASVVYSNIVFAGGIAVWLMNLLANVLRGTGHMAVAAGAIVAGEAAHLVLSPSLILGLGPFPALGVAGAGVAVLGSYATGAAVLACYLCSRRSAVRFRRATAALRFALWGSVLRVGTMAALTMLMTQGITVVVTSFIARFGAATLAGYGAAQRLELLQNPITFALGSAVVAMTAANLGAGRPARAGLIARCSIVIAGAIGLLFGLAALLAPGAWMALFVTDPQAVAAGVTYLSTVGWSLPLLGLGYGLAFALMGAGLAARATIATALRLAIVLGAGWLAVSAWGDGIDTLSPIVATATVLFVAAVALGGIRLLRAGDAGLAGRFSP